MSTIKELSGRRFGRLGNCCWATSKAQANNRRGALREYVFCKREFRSIGRVHFCSHQCFRFYRRAGTSYEFAPKRITSHLRRVTAQEFKERNVMTKILGEPCCDCGKTIIGMHQFGTCCRKWWLPSGIGEYLPLCKDCVE